MSESASITIPYSAVGDFETGQYDGDTYFSFHRKVRDWLYETDVLIDYWFPGDGHQVIVLDFERRGLAAIFMTRFL